MSDGDRILFVGGWGKGGCQSTEMNNDPNAKSLHVLDVSTLRWYSVECIDKASPLKHTYYHNACILDSQVAVFGGFDGRQALNLIGNIEVRAVNVSVDN
jgi:hypothetical protein